MATSRLADQVGRVLGGRYRLKALLGTGASARVFLADDTTLARQVAVKLLHPALADDDRFLRRFRAEARAAAGLSHPGVMAVYDWGEEDDGPYLVSEYLGGGSLRAVLDHGERLTPSQALLIGLDTARGLDYAHRRGLIHRDIKPGNLLFDLDGRVRIADFGLARALAEAAWTEPVGALLGTVRYAAPEQVRNLSVDGRADVYSLGVVLLEAITGTAPFASDSAAGSLMARLDGPVPIPEHAGPLAPILASALEVEPERRPDAGQLAEALESVARQLPRPEPLRLIEPAEAPHAFSELNTADLRDLVPRMPKEAGLGEPPSDPDPTDLALARAIGLVDDATELGTVIPDRRIRRWPKVLVGLLIVAILAAGGALAYSRMLPSHELPDVRGRDQRRALSMLRFADVKVRVVKAYSDDRPEGTVLSQSPPAGEKVREGTPVRLTVSQGPPPVPVPDLTTLDRAAATDRLAGAGLRVGRVDARYSEEDPKDLVLEWAGQGSSIAKGGAVDLVVSAGPQPRRIDDWAGKPYEEVAAAMRAGGLVPVRVDAFSETVPVNMVIATTPGPGALADKGSKVSITVSKGPDLVAIPDVKGLSVSEAQARLASAGLQVSNTFGPPDKTVFFVDPTPGTKVKRGTGVNLYTR